MVTATNEKDLQNPATAEMVRKFLGGVEGIDPKDRLKLLRLIENLTMGRAAVGYLTESMHGAGSPQAQRIMIARQADVQRKKQYAKDLAKTEDDK